MNENWANFENEKKKVRFKKKVLPVRLELSTIGFKLVYATNYSTESLMKIETLDLVVFKIFVSLGK